MTLAHQLVISQLQALNENDARRDRVPSDRLLVCFTFIIYASFWLHPNHLSRNLPSEYAEGVRLGVGMMEDGGFYTEVSRRNSDRTCLTLVLQIGQTETVVQRVNPSFDVSIPIVVRLHNPQLLKISM